ncbi:hypothetical protein ACQKM9_16745 [Viridibacillus sp. NPDC093762]|uniref:hypothetical protein n=1 Tax=Viridibacillus sp. NPDC093762 TaxID=3390720 RepID=UPI003D02854B
MEDFDALWDYEHPEKTEQKFISLLTEAEESGNIGYKAELLTQVAFTQGLQAKFDIEHETLDHVDSLLNNGLVDTCR